MPNEAEYKGLKKKIEGIENKLKELRVRSEEREKQIEDREKLTGRWKERAVYIAIIVGSVSILLTIIMMK